MPAIFLGFFTRFLALSPLIIQAGLCHVHVLTEARRSKVQEDRKSSSSDSSPNPEL